MKHIAFLFTIIIAAGCSSTTGTGSPGSGSPSAGQTFLACEKADLAQAVEGGGGTLLGTVAADLSKGDYADLIAKLVAKFGGDTIGCAVLAVAPSAGNAGSGARTAGALTPTEVHARELAATYGWKKAPAP